MTVEQINHVLNQYGGKKKFVRERLFALLENNSREIYPNPSMTADEREAAFTFDDDHELVIVKERDKIWHFFNDYAPTNSTMYVPYEIIEGISVLEDTPPTAI